MHEPLHRRSFLITLGVSSAAIASAAHAQVMVDEKDTQAAALGYVAGSR